jgi:hypothetical protein
VLWIRIGLNADPDPDPAYFLTADPELGSQTNADPGQTFHSLNAEFYMKNILYADNRSQNISRRYKSLKNQDYLLILVNLAPGFRIRIPTTDPDPEEQNQCGSVRILIHNTGNMHTSMHHSHMNNTNLFWGL